MAIEKVLEEQSRLAVHVAKLYPLQGEWMEKDYFALPDSNRIVELSEGELIMPPHPTDTHQLIVGNLYRAIHAFVKTHDLGVIRFAPLPVRLWPGKIREPDILFLTHEHADRRGEQAWGPPDLTVEVLSPGTEDIDREEKFAEYARAGISEYWVVDPRQWTIEVFVFTAGVYALSGRFGSGQVVSSRVLAGFQISVDEVFTE